MKNHLENLLTHFGDELSNTATILKKFRDIRNYECLDSNSKPIKMKTESDLKAFLQTEINAYQAAIDELEGA